MQRIEDLYRFFHKDGLLNGRSQGIQEPSGKGGSTETAWDNGNQRIGGDWLWNGADGVCAMRK